MTPVEFEPSPALRALCVVAVVAMVAQLLLLAEPAFAARIVSLTWDKLIHFAFFAAIAFLLWVSTDKRWPLVIWVTVLLIGALDETHQAFVPGRTADINDLLADGFGAAAALMVMKRVSPPGSLAANARARSTRGE